MCEQAISQKTSTLFTYARCEMPQTSQQKSGGGRGGEASPAETPHIFDPTDIHRREERERRQKIGIQNVLPTKKVRKGRKSSGNFVLSSSLFPPEVTSSLCVSFFSSMLSIFLKSVSSPSFFSSFFDNGIAASLWCSGRNSFVFCNHSPVLSSFAYL